MKKEYKGVSVVGGVGKGKVRIVDCFCPDFEPKKVEDSDKELGRFVRALKTYCVNTRSQMEHIRKTLGSNESSILNSHIKMTHDLALQSELITLISKGMCAEEALSKICDMYINRFLNADEEFVRQLAADVLDVKTSVLNLLLGIDEPDVEEFDEETIVVARELPPSVVARLDQIHTKGIVVEYGNPNSHGAYLAKALGIPSITDVINIHKILKNGDTITVDGNTGTVYTE